MADANSEEQLVTQHNDLIRAVAEMDRMPLKLFEVIVGAYDSRKSQNSVRIKKDLFYEFLNINSTNRSYRLQVAINELHKHSVFLVRSVEQDGSVTKRSIAPIEEFYWNSAKNYVEVTFSRKILPYISMLQDNFTQYKLTDIAGLNSKHAITLYKLIAMNFNQYQYYIKHKPRFRNSHQLDQYANPYIELKELRRITNTMNKYSRFSSFDSTVLKNPIEEINNNTDFNVTYEKKISNRKVVGITFHITKEGFNDKISEPDISDNEKHKESLEEAYQEALKSTYTIMLVSAGVFDLVTIMNNKGFAVKLLEEVYPAYDAFIEEFSETKLKNHINHVSKYKNNDVSTDTLPNYLYTSITSYIDELREKNTKETSKKISSSKKKITRQIETLPEWATENDPKPTKQLDPEEAEKLQVKINNQLEKLRGRKDNTKLED
ncbi:replication initiation protein [Pediococcus pentosaceus]|uniref:replication initiation protein n=1 Tax=Pediococcus pentosaceus TaxID=1255 RepID=UPI0021AF2DB4|nr:replication initiation protein [Pediococcus pentosaceus]